MWCIQGRFLWRKICLSYYFMRIFSCRPSHMKNSVVWPFMWHTIVPYWAWCCSSNTVWDVWKYLIQISAWAVTVLNVVFVGPPKFWASALIRPWLLSTFLLYSNTDSVQSWILAVSMHEPQKQTLFSATQFCTYSHNCTCSHSVIHHTENHCYLTSWTVPSILQISCVLVQSISFSHLSIDVLFHNFIV
jgi:hypothetical protein